jgi:predicted amidohydrolase
MVDLILKGGRIIDPATGRDEMADIAFGDGKVTEIGRDLAAKGAETVDLRGLLVVPGLIDLHTHVYWGGTPPVTALVRMCSRGPRGGRYLRQQPGNAPEIPEG